jgi:hypothetical protein
MGHPLLDIAASNYHPHTLKLLGRTFDEVWADIAGNYDVKATEDRRRRLALIILNLAGAGERNIDGIKDAALEIMRLVEQPMVSKDAALPRTPTAVRRSWKLPTARPLRSS